MVIKVEGERPVKKLIKNDRRLKDGERVTEYIPKYSRKGK